MPEDNMNNEDMNLNGLPSEDGVVEAGTSEPEIAASAEVPIENENAQNAEEYNFEQMDSAQANEIKIDTEPVNEGPVTVRPVEFTHFDSYTPTNTDTNKNLELLMDIKLELTVELGRCQLPVKKVLELTRGSIIELDKVAGESVELFANGKHVANGEVVVIEDNFGLRITSITDPEERIKSL